ncbi:MAG: DUF721 domain-containing protein [Planctomycetes bacterium]|nr:DUF721 domain-containing protein [Planctomycetota bacterium]
MMVRLKDLLHEVTDYLGLNRRAELQDVAEAYARAAPPALLQASRILSLRQGVLEIEVSSAPLLMELKQYQRPAILQRLQKTHPHIRDLQFRPARV